MVEETQNILIQRFLDKSATKEEMAQLETWLHESVENRRVFDIYNEIWQVTGKYSKNLIFNIDRNWQIVEQEIGRMETPMMRLKRGRKLNWLNIAASIAILISIAVSLLYLSNQASSNQHIQWVQLEAPKGEKAKILLDDGTVIWLNSESTLKYAVNNKQRMVQLNGEGYFEVTKNKKMPFIVDADGAQIKVLGTRFNVSAHKKDSIIKTSLLEGSVSITSLSGQEMLLKPGQQAKVNKNTCDISLSLCNAKLVNIWKKERLRFYSTPFRDVISSLENWYGVAIICDDKTLNSERFTMTIKDESISDVFERMALTTNIKYNIKNNTVKINNRNGK